LRDENQWGLVFSRRSKWLAWVGLVGWLVGWVVAWLGNGALGTGISFDGNKWYVVRLALRSFRHLNSENVSKTLSLTVQWELRIWWLATRVRYCVVPGMNGIDTDERGLYFLFFYRGSCWQLVMSEREEFFQRSGAPSANQPANPARPTARAPANSSANPTHKCTTSPRRPVTSRAHKCTAGYSR
jgi:hypothetical protein